MTHPLGQEDCSIILVHTRNPLNIGAAARAMVNFGFHDLRVVEPWQPSWHEARSAVGAASVLASAREFSTLAEAVADCNLVLGTAGIARRNPVQPVISLPNLGTELRCRLPSGRLAIVFGSEKSGLSNDDCTHCSAILHIPTQPEQESVNLGQAVAVCLYELARHIHPAPPPVPPPPAPHPATAADRERLTQALQRILQLSEYIKPGADQSILYQVREMLHRLNPSVDDSHWLLGMLHRIERHLSGNHPHSDS
ncbi:MAG: RNA methyltransferase [Acidobacteriaceae bacterium]